MTDTTGLAAWRTRHKKTRRSVEGHNGRNFARTAAHSSVRAGMFCGWRRKHRSSKAGTVNQKELARQLPCTVHTHPAGLSPSQSRGTQSQLLHCGSAHAAISQICQNFRNQRAKVYTMCVRACRGKTQPRACRGKTQRRVSSRHNSSLHHVPARSRSAHRGLRAQPRVILRCRCRARRASSRTVQRT